MAARGEVRLVRKAAALKRPSAPANLLALFARRAAARPLSVERKSGTRRSRERAAELRGLREAERKISLVAREWTATFDTIPDMIAIIGLDFSFRRVNMSLARRFGAHPRDLIGRRCHEVIHGLARPWPQCPHLRAVEERRSVSQEMNDQRVGLPLMVTCSPYYSEEGRILGTVHVARDISAQKEAAASQERLIAELREALSRVKLLSGLLPICCACKKIRDDAGYWNQLEEYLSAHSEVEFTHGICPECSARLYP